MAKSLPSAQIPLIERPHLEPLYFIHIYLPGETLYFSDRNFKFNNRDYESYLLDIPETVHSIEQFGGYLNINARLTFRNERFRSYNRLIDFFIANPITRREMDIFVLYLQDGAIPGTDVSIRLHRVSIGELRRINAETFDVELFSILHSLDKRRIFTQINRTLWPYAAERAIGEYENIVYGAVSGIVCHPVVVGAATTLRTSIDETGTTLELTDTELPLSFPFSGTVQVDEERITYTAKDAANRRLTGLTRGASSTVAAAHKEGAVVWQILSSYKYLIAGHRMRSVSRVYISGNLVAPANYSINLNDGGKSTVSFSRFPLNKHSHGQKSIYVTRPFSASRSNIRGTITWFGVPENLYDNDENTYLGFAYSGTVPDVEGEWVLNIPAYNGDPPDAVYVNVIYQWERSWSSPFFRLTVPQTTNLPLTTGKGSTRIKLTNPVVPSTIRFRSSTEGGTSPGIHISHMFEVWIEVERWSVNPSGTSDEVLNPVVTVDGEGYQDDASGTYTGTANALIQNPSDIRRHILVALLGRAMGDIGDSFTSMRTFYNTQIPGGYKMGFVLSELGTEIADIFKSLDFQSCSQMREDGGKFELGFSYIPYTYTYSPDRFTGGTATASSQYNVSYVPAYAFDDNTGTAWGSAQQGGLDWIKYDFGAGVSRVVNRFRMLTDLAAGFFSRVKDFTIYGSNDNTNWTFLMEGQHGDNSNWEQWDFSNNIGYRYILIGISTVWPVGGIHQRALIREMEIMEKIATAGSPPTPVMTIDETIFIGDPFFSHTSAMSIRNLIRCRFDLDRGGYAKARFNRFKKQIQKSDPISIAKYGELSEDIDLPAVYIGDMAEDIANWLLIQKKDIIPIVEMTCNRMVRSLERGDYFILNNTPVSAWNGTLWRVLDIQETPQRQTYNIKAIRYMSP